jgi:hypothetical protein
LQWKAATDNEALYGYQVFRAEGDNLYLHYASVRGQSTRFEDGRAVAGARYRYFIRPYDLAGNRGPASPSVEIVMPWEGKEADSPPSLRVASDPTASGACTSAGIS